MHFQHCVTELLVLSCLIADHGNIFTPLIKRQSVIVFKVCADGCDKLGCQRKDALNVHHGIIPGVVAEFSELFGNLFVSAHRFLGVEGSHCEGEHSHIDRHVLHSFPQLIDLMLCFLLDSTHLQIGKERAL